MNSYLDGNFAPARRSERGFCRSTPFLELNSSIATRHLKPYTLVTAFHIEALVGFGTVEDCQDEMKESCELGCVCVEMK